MKNNNKKTEFWDKRRGVIHSSKGGWKMGEGVFSHGYNLLDDLVGEKSYFQLMILHSTGVLVERPVADWFEAIFGCLSWPDPRIWCNQIGALGGSMRASIVAATTAGTLAGDSRTYGQKPVIEGMRFIQQALADFKNGLSVEKLVNSECERHGGKPYIMGYARPLAKGDERVTAMERVSRDLGLTFGDHLKLAYEIENILSDKFDESMNINGYASACFSDFGFTPDEGYRICTLLVSSGVTACYLDTLQKPPESFLPMRCDDIDYQGPPPRPVPDKE